MVRPKKSVTQKSRKSLLPVSTRSREDLQEIYDFSISVLERRYDSYNWLEAKVLTLVTLNGLLLTGFFVLITQTQLSKNQFLLTVAFISIIPLVISLSLAIYNVIPKLNSGLIQNPNIRTIYGTNQFRDSAEYFTKFMNLDLKEMVRLNTEQIRGMTANIIKSNKEIRIAAGCSIFSLVFFLGLFFVYIRG